MDVQCEQTVNNILGMSLYGYSSNWFFFSVHPQIHVSVEAPAQTALTPSTAPACPVSQGHGAPLR